MILACLCLTTVKLPPYRQFLDTVSHIDSHLLWLFYVHEITLCLLFHLSDSKVLWYGQFMIYSQTYPWHQYDCYSILFTRCVCIMGAGDCSQLPCIQLLNCISSPWFGETGAHYPAPADLKLEILLPLPCSRFFFELLAPKQWFGDFLLNVKAWP